MSAGVLVMITLPLVAMFYVCGLACGELRSIARDVRRFVDDAEAIERNSRGEG